MTGERVRYSVAVGRPHRELKRLGNSLTWAAWWTGEPTLDPLPFVRPDAFGGARSRDDVEALVRRHAQSAGHHAPLEQVSARFCQRWRAWRRAEHEQLVRERAAQWAHDFFRDHPEFRGGLRPLHEFVVPPPWAALLDLSWPAYCEADVAKAFRARAFEQHPDRGGSHDAFVALSRARDAALAHLREVRA